jgi:hypothetical protein
MAEIALPVGLDLLLARLRADLERVRHCDKLGHAQTRGPSIWKDLNSVTQVTCGLQADGSYGAVSVLGTLLSLAGQEGAVAGSAPPVTRGNAYRSQAGTFTLTTDGAGGFTHALPLPFPSGVLVPLLHLLGAAGTGIRGTCSLTQITGTVFSGAAALATTAVTIGYLVIGF